MYEAGQTEITLVPGGVVLIFEGDYGADGRREHHTVELSWGAVDKLSTVYDQAFQKIERT